MTINQTKDEMNLPEGWKEALFAEMDRRFEVGSQKGRHHDGAICIDDTQIGVEFAIDFIESLLAAAPTPPAQGQVSLPKVTPYKSTSIPESEWRNEPIDYWLRKMLENCDYHDGLVIEATLVFLASLKTPPATTQIPGLRLNAALSEEDIKAINEYIAPEPDPARKCNCDLRTRLVGDGCEVCNSELAAEMAAPEVEPVYLLDARAGYWKEIRQSQYSAWLAQHKDKLRVLYTHPANDGLRKAAEEYLEFMDRDKDDCFEEIIEFVNRYTKRLRAELDKGKS